jgi:hypothetical protein
MVIPMGMAGLDINRLAGLLDRKKVECALLDGDAAFDHCVLRLSSVGRPAVTALLEYENQGGEPRLAGLVFLKDESLPQRHGYRAEWERTLELRGGRTDDPNKIAQWVRREFLDLAG